MPKETPSQRDTVHRVMHEFKHGELERSDGGKGGKVKSRRQAVAIALSEAGASNQESGAANRKSRKRTSAKEASGRTAMQAKEGKGAMKRMKRRDAGPTRAELYADAKQRDIAGRSRMSKAELQRALRRH